MFLTASSMQCYKINLLTEDIVITPNSEAIVIAVILGAGGLGAILYSWLIFIDKYTQSKQ